jgi:hypothetical protein
MPFGPLPPSARPLLGHLCAQAAQLWRRGYTVCDDVMGGVSEARLRVPSELSENSGAVFEGVVRSDYNGGFATVRVPIAPFSERVAGGTAAPAGAAVASRAATAMRAAISVGVPLFNAGDHGACRDAYVGVVRELTAGARALEWASTASLAAERSRLLAAADKAVAEDATRGAWTMRRALDGFLAGAATTAAGGYDALLLYVRGDGRAYALRAHRPAASGLGDIAYEARFGTVRGAEQEVVVPLRTMRPRWRGSDVEGAPPLSSVSELADVGFLAVKGDGVGTFALECMGIYAVVEAEQARA